VPTCCPVREEEKEKDVAAAVFEKLRGEKRREYRNCHMTSGAREGKEVGEKKKKEITLLLPLVLYHFVGGKGGS